MSKPLPRYTHDTDPRKIERIISQSQETDQPTTVSRATLPGDNRRLRGIPVIGGISGTSPGTDPHQALEAKYRGRRFQHKRLHRA